MIYEGRIIWQGPAADDRPLRQSPTSTSSSTAAPKARSDAGPGAVTVGDKRAASRDGVCQSCGASHPPNGAGAARPAAPGTRIVEEAVRESAPKGLSAGRRPQARIRRPRRQARRTRPQRADTASPSSTASPAAALVPGSALLIGGDPGIGKSTLLLQVAARARRAAHAASPMSPARRRSTRSGCAPSVWPGRRRVQLAAATNVRDILATLDAGQPPELVVIDSIQTMYVDKLDSAPGTVAQVRASRRRADPPRQAPRLRPVAGRPRHQGGR